MLACRLELVFLGLEISRNVPAPSLDRVELDHLHADQRIIGTGKKTTLVPKGRGPFSSWEEAAVDALMNCHPYAGKNKDWSIAGTLDILERYNGLGYRNKGLPSPYLWAGTDQYVKGKYVADGKYDPNHVDQQLGVAPILMKIREGKASPSAPVKPAPAPAPVQKPDAAPTPAGGKGDSAATALLAFVILALVAAAVFILGA